MRSHLPRKDLTTHNFILRLQYKHMWRVAQQQSAIFARKGRRTRVIAVNEKTLFAGDTGSLPVPLHQNSPCSVTCNTTQKHGAEL